MARPKSRGSTSFHSLDFPEGIDIEEIRLRRREDEDEKRHRLWKDARSFWIKEASVYIVALAVLVTTVYCFRALWHSAGFAREDRQWATSTLTSLLVGIVGYIFGKATK